MTADNFSPRAFRRSLRHACLTDAEYRVANELCEFAGIGKPVVWPSVPTLAENCCMKDRGVQYTLGRLEAKGVIACVTRSKGGRGQTSRWQLLVKGDTVSDPETVHSHAPFTNPETVHGDDRNGAPARTQTVHGHAPEVVKEGGRRRGGAPPGPALDARAGAPPTKAAADAAPTLPLNHDDALHIETWLEWAANTDLPVERPSRGCPRHPDGNGPPCGACKANRELSERWEEERAGWKEDSRDQRARIKGCPHCNEHGQYTDDEGLWWCEHHGPPSSVSADPPNIRSLVIPEKQPWKETRMTFRDRNSCVDLTCYGSPGFTLGVVIDPTGVDDDSVDFLLIDEAHLAAGGVDYTRGLDIPHEQVGPLPQLYATRIHRATT